MIIWGSGGQTLDLGEIEKKACATCEKDRPFKLFLNYRWSHLYYFRWVTKKQYMLLCDVCRRGWELKAKEIEQKLRKSPIPFMTRFGWTIPLGIIGALMSWAWIAEFLRKAH